jgi:Transglycosylase SLT domain
MRLAGPLLVCVFALCCSDARAQAGAGPSAADEPAVATVKPADMAPADLVASQSVQSSPPEQNPPTADDICRAIEQSAAENALPVEFFARVIWQESRFNALAVSPKGAEGIAQFMPATASWHGLADPFDPIQALHHSAGYLHELMTQFGNLGLAAASYNAGPGRVSAWLAGKRTLPSETRNYVAIITGWTVDEWASPSPPQNAETTIPQGVPCTRLANLILAPKEQAQRIAAYIPRWGAQLTSNWSETRAWETYRNLQKQYASLIGDREPIVLRARLPGMGAMPRTIIRIADDDRVPLDKLCARLIAAGGACVVLRNRRG